jgi:hypothetical protein
MTTYILKSSSWKSEYCLLINQKFWSKRVHEIRCRTVHAGVGGIRSLFLLSSLQMFHRGQCFSFSNWTSLTPGRLEQRTWKIRIKCRGITPLGIHLVVILCPSVRHRKWRCHHAMNDAEIDSGSMILSPRDHKGIRLTIYTSQKISRNTDAGRRSIVDVGLPVGIILSCWAAELPSRQAWPSGYEPDVPCAGAYEGNGACYV